MQLFTNELSDGLLLSTNYWYFHDGADHEFCAGSCSTSDGMHISINNPVAFCCLNLHLSYPYASCPSKSSHWFPSRISHRLACNPTPVVVLVACQPKICIELVQWLLFVSLYIFMYWLFYNWWLSSYWKSIVYDCLTSNMQSVFKTILFSP